MFNLEHIPDVVSRLATNLHWDRGSGGAAPQKLYTIFHQKYELVTQILVLNNSDQTVKYEEQYSIM